MQSRQPLAEQSRSRALSVSARRAALVSPSAPHVQSVWLRGGRRGEQRAQITQITEHKSTQEQRRAQRAGSGNAECNVGARLAMCHVSCAIAHWTSQVVANCWGGGEDWLTREAHVLQEEVRSRVAWQRLIGSRAKRVQRCAQPTLCFCFCSVLYPLYVQKLYRLASTCVLQRYDKQTLARGDTALASLVAAAIAYKGYNCKVYRLQTQ